VKKKVEWTEKAIESLNEYIDIIKEDSPDAAKKVKKEIVLSAKKLSSNYNIYQIDEYYPSNP